MCRAPNHTDCGCDGGFPYKRYEYRIEHPYYTTGEFPCEACICGLWAKTTCPVCHDMGRPDGNCVCGRKIVSAKCPRRRNGNCSEDCDVCDRRTVYTVLPEHASSHTLDENGFCQACFEIRFEEWKARVTGKQPTFEVPARESDIAPCPEEIQRDVDTVIRILEKYSKFPGLFRIVM